MNRLILLVFCLGFALTPLLSFSQERKVLFIGIDGCRSDALIAANTPNLDELISNGTWSPDALTIPPTWSGTGWSSMLTGVWPGKHGVVNNSFSSPNFGNYHHFYSFIESAAPSIQTESIVHWGPIHSEIIDQVDYQLINGSDITVKDNAVHRLTNYDPDVLFLHFDDVDAAGHASTFNPTNPQYLNSIETTDGLVGEVLDAVSSRPNYANENWLIMVSTDHGGNDAGHGGNTLEEQQIFIIVSGDDVPTSVLSSSNQEDSWSNAHQFNNTRYARALNPNNLNVGTSDFSVECWVKTNGWSGDPAIISNKNWISGNNAGWVLAGNTDGSTWKVNLGDGADRIDLDGGPIDDGLWHHIAISCDRDESLTIYQDGRIMGQFDMSDIGNLNSGLDFCFGQDGTQSYPDFWNGYIAEARLWDVALDPTTMGEYACRKLDLSHSEYSNLRAYWPMDEGVGINLVDDLGASDGQIVNGANWDTGVQNINCPDFSNTPRIIDLVPTALKHLQVDIDPSWNLDGNCFALPEPQCEISGYTLGLQTGCEALSGNFLQEVFVDYQNPQDLNTIVINGQSFDISNSENRFLLNGLTATGATMNLEIYMADDPGCSSVFSSAFQAPLPCDSAGCMGDLNGDEVVNTADLTALLSTFGATCD